jgi:hypothetical protein
MYSDSDLPFSFLENIPEAYARLMPRALASQISHEDRGEDSGSSTSLCRASLNR